MGNKMLIDATHPEETRVVVLRGHRVEEFDYESASKKQLRGNIYLAKVTRVEPSLQAAFVNYGGNRHGFLAFSEIHHDYYQLPMAERQALKQQEEEFRSRGVADGAEDDEAFAAGAETDHEQPDLADTLIESSAHLASEVEESAGDPTDFHSGDGDQPLDEDDDPERQAAALKAALPATRYSPKISQASAEESDETASEPSASGSDTYDRVPGEAANLEVRAEDEITGERSTPQEPGDYDVDHNGAHDDEDGGDLDHVESVGSEDALEEVPERHRRRRRTYKIQEVIKRGQILLVQVVKEERGNKGAALTTYLSLAGRYTVLMPNTGSGGGISRKISSPSDRKRLREIATELEVPDGMGLIIRTAGAARTKTELKRDYEYLLRLWENVRELTLKSSAPSLVYEEGDLIKRSIRDLYSREIDEVLVAGDDAYRDAKDFMRMLMPSHAKNVQPYKEPEPLFTRYEVERQLNAMFSPQVTLHSGGYIIINQTEALVAIDVNSGKSTREFSIEDTALKTNLEAAEEISRQLRLRDLAGLIVVDFIDMEEKRNNRSVERKLKECLRNDRARIQVGRISHFGLLEMSRQRIRTGMIEGSTIPCSHCQGVGFVRSTESVALSVLRSLEDWLRTNTPCDLNSVTSGEVALYILNQKRTYLHDIEARHSVTISVTASEKMHGANFYIEKVSVAAAASGTSSAPITQNDRIIQPFEAESSETADDKDKRPRRGRRRRRGGREDQNRREVGANTKENVADTEAGDDADVDRRSIAASSDADGGDANGNPRRRTRRRGRRGGRQQRSARSAEAANLDQAETTHPGQGQQPYIDDYDGLTGGQGGGVPESKAVARHEAPEPAVQAEAAPAPSAETEAEQPAAHRQRSFRGSQGQKAAPDTNSKEKANGQHHAKSADKSDESGEAGLDAHKEAVAALEEPSAPPPPRKPRGTKRGWWQRRDL